MCDSTADPPAVSAIVRTRRAGAALRRTLRSLLSPLQGHIEIIVVDEDHDAAAGDICRQLAAEHPGCLTVAGVGACVPAAARNRGLDLARGEYVAFIEGGDSVSERFCADLLQEARRVQADICRSLSGTTDDDGLLHNDPVVSRSAAGSCADRALLRMNAAIYCRAFLDAHDLRFPEELCYADDVVFEYRARRAATQLAQCLEAFYRACAQPPGQAELLSGRELSDAARAAAIIDGLARNGPDPVSEAGRGRLCYELMEWMYQLSDRAAVPADAAECRKAACRLALASPYAPQFRSLLAAGDQDQGRPRAHPARPAHAPGRPGQAPAVSVIVPVYNVRDYVGRALESAVCQTLPGIEIIVVDDGSTDGSATLCGEYAGRRPDLIRVIRQKNSGVAAARNRGLQEARGEYVAFLDADDYLADDFCQVLYDAAMRRRADIAKAVTVLPRPGGGPEERDAWVNSAIRSCRSRLCFMFYMFCALYRREFLERHALRFREELIYCEDVLFLHEAVLHCRALALSDDTFYYHCRRIFSADALRLSRLKMQNAIAVFTAIAASIARCRAPQDLPGAGMVYGSCVHNLELAAGKASDPADAALARRHAAALRATCPLEPRYLEMWRTGGRQG